MRKIVFIVFVLIALVSGIGIGYSKGFADGVGWAVRIGLNFVEIDVDEEMIINGIFAYKNNINNCFQNASILYNERN